MRLAWFTPWPPARHAAARRSRDAARALAAQGYAIDLVVEDGAAHEGEAPDHVSIVPASRTTADRYDLAVYQIVNASAGAFVWPRLVEWPGIAMLHDTHVYAARSAHAVHEAAAFRDGFRRNHPEASPDIAELAVHGFSGPYTLHWPMLRTVMTHSRLVAVSADPVARNLRHEWPETAIATVAPAIAPPTADVAAARARLGLPGDAVLFGTCGARHAGHAAARRLEPVLRAFASAARRRTGTHLVIAGEAEPRDVPVPPDVAGHVLLTGRRGADQSAELAAAVDVWIDLRWPNHEVVSDEWLAAIAAGRPTVTFDLSSTADRPMVDPQSWQSKTPRPPIGVAIDVLDEEHSLRLALCRLAEDAPLRECLGRAAREYWRARHTIAHMTADWTRAIESLPIC
jgi:glycosyltransferase involved in cell wall biosynthesis